MSSGVEIDRRDVDGLIAVHRPVRACDDGALRPTGRVLALRPRLPLKTCVTAQSAQA